jgi:hypothetical protein
MSALSNKIWITRKARIHAETRLLFKEKVSFIIMVWYSFILVVVSLFNLKDNVSNDMYILSASIGILVASVYLSSQKFTERALALRMCYIQLDELYSRAKQAEDSRDTSLVASIHREYSTVLQNVENHIHFDYLSFRFEHRHDSGLDAPVTWRELILEYLPQAAWRWLLVIVLVILPLLLKLI